MRKTVPQQWANCVAAALRLFAISGAAPAADYYLANKPGSGTGTKVYRDLAYAKPENPQQTLDVFALADGQRLPVVVWIRNRARRRRSTESRKTRPGRLRCLVCCALRRLGIAGRHRTSAYNASSPPPDEASGRGCEESCRVAFVQVARHRVLR